MASSNINKIVQSNFNLKPWILSKNTNEIVNTCIQKIYKQMPNSFRRDFKPAKVAAVRPENMGPLRTFKNQERQMHVTKETPRLNAVKKLSKTYDRPSNNFVNNLKASNKNSAQIAQKLPGVTLTPSKKLLKSPNYKIYKSRRFGSSASSSRSSLFRRYDERRLQRQHYPPQVNYLVRSFHTSQFEGTYAKYLMPVRNQLVESRLGSVPDAIKISTDIQNDLMPIDSHTRERISFTDNKKSNMNFKKFDRLEVWKHPPSIDRYQNGRSMEYITKSVSRNTKQSRLPRLSPEHRDYVKFNINRVTPLKHPMPPNELFTAKHDRNNTELHEKHRRNRMKKLGLMEPSSPSSTELEDNNVENLPRTRQQQLQSSTVSAAALANHSQSGINNVSLSFQSKWTPNILSHLEASTVVQNAAQRKSNTIKLKSKLAANKTISQSQDGSQPAQQQYSKQFPKINSIGSDSIKQESCLLTSNPTNLSSHPKVNLCSKDSPFCQEVFKPISYTSTGPTAAARIQLINSGNYSAYRDNRTYFFRPKKY